MLRIYDIVGATILYGLLAFAGVGIVAALVAHSAAYAAR